MLRNPRALLVIFLLVATRTHAEEPTLVKVAGFVIRRDANSVVVCRGDAPLLRYRFADVPRKPYVQELYSPAGVQVLRNAPHDHLHHHALMFAVIADGIDFWTEGEGHGTQDHVRLEPAVAPTAGDSDHWSLVHELLWHAADGTPVLSERRTLTLFDASESDPTLVSWCSLLCPANGRAPITLSGTHYDGLGLRFLESMDQEGRFRHAAGKTGPHVRGTEHVTPSKWSCYTATADGKRVTVALFDHPNNARHPAGMFTMTAPFSYLSATPNIWKTPLDLGVGQSLLYRYGVAVWDGEPPTEEIESWYTRWVSQLDSSGVCR